MITAAIYSRKSKFTGKGESIQNQIEMCKEYVENRFRVDHFLIYEDEGYSGVNTKRPKYTQMINDMAQGKFKLLICYRLDRLSRNISDFSDLVVLLQEHNIDFISIREQFDTSTPMGRAMMYISSVFAQLERETIAERIRDNMHHLARTGRWLGGRTPTGFKSQETYSIDEDQFTRKSYQLIPIQEELELVKTLYEKYIELGSLTQLESWVMIKGIKTRSDKKFDKSILKVILTNPVYAIADIDLYSYFLYKKADISSDKQEFDGKHSLMVFNKYDERKTKVIKRDESQWIVAIGKHNGLIPSSDWIKVQGMIENNRKKAPRSGTGKYGLITSFLRCGLCGSKMRVTVSRRKSGTYYYYKCLMKERSRGSLCKVSNINGPLADKKAINEIKKIPYDKKQIYFEMEKSRAYLNNYLNNSIVYSNEREIILMDEITTTKKSIDNLTMQLARPIDKMVAKHIINKIEELDSKLQELQSNLEIITKKEELVNLDQHNLNSISTIIEDFSENIDSLNFQEKKRILTELIQEIIWDGATLKIKFIIEDRRIINDAKY